MLRSAYGSERPSQAACTQGPYHLLEPVIASIALPPLTAHTRRCFTPRPTAAAAAAAAAGVAAASSRRGTAVTWRGVGISCRHG